MHPALLVLKNTALQFGWLAAALAVSGFVLSWLARKTCTVHQQFIWPRFGLYVFGLIGIPVHEFSHYIFCKVFRLEVGKIKWFDANAKGGAHGSVIHYYNPWNVYHRVGHVFVGFGPVLVAPLLLTSLFLWLVPGGEAIHLAAFDLSLSTSANTVANASLGWNIGAFAVSLAAQAKVLFGALFAKANFTQPAFYGFLYVAFAIVSQLELSREDLKVAASGFIPMFLVLLAVNGIAALFGADLHSLASSYGARGLAIWTAILAGTALVSALNFVVCWAGMGLVNLMSGRPTIDPF